MIHFINKPMPGKLPKKTARALLDIEDAKVIPIIRDPEKVTEDSDAVFYFPGCGSERLFSQVGLATQAMLYELGAQCVLPPGYLCCGYPQTAAGDSDKGERIIVQNRVHFHRLATTLNYLDIRTVIVSCGTCLDQLEKYEFDKIFPGCPAIDIHEYLLEKGVKVEGVAGVRYMYHDPCHTPIKTMQPVKLVNELMGGGVPHTDRCCGESGTLAMTRPDISTQVRFSKEESLRRGVQAMQGQNVKVLTSCPSCLQGLARFSDDTGAEADYIVVELARRLLGRELVARIRQKSECRRDRTGPALMNLPELKANAAPQFVDAQSCKAWLDNVPLANVGGGAAGPARRARDLQPLSDRRREPPGGARDAARVGAPSCRSSRPSAS